MIHAGAAPLGPEHVANLKRVVPQALIRQGYGMTETSAGVIGQKAADAVPGSIGTLLANNEAKLIDENGNGKQSLSFAKRQWGRQRESSRFPWFMQRSVMISAVNCSYAACPL